MITIIRKCHQTKPIKQTKKNREYHTCRIPCLLARELAEDSIELDEDDSAMSALLASSSFSLVAKSPELGKPEILLSFALPPDFSL